MPSMKLDIEKFDRIQNFDLWQVKMKALGTKYGMKKGFRRSKMSVGMTVKKWFKSSKSHTIVSLN